jgi:hypothetical protein
MKVRKIIDDIEEMDTRERRRDPLHQPRIAAGFGEVETGEIQPVAGFQVQYELRLRFAVRYWANQAEKPHAKKRAEQAMQDVLYRDVIGRLAQIRSMLDNCGRQEIDIALLELIGEMRP